MSWLEGKRVAQDDWKLRWRHCDWEALSVGSSASGGFPAHRERPTELDEPLTALVFALPRKPRHDSHNERRPLTTREHRATVSRLMRARLERAIHTRAEVAHRRRRKTTNPEETTLSQDSDLDQSPPVPESTEDESHPQVPEIVKTLAPMSRCGVPVPVFDVLGVGEPPTQPFLRRLQVDPDTEVSSTRPSSPDEHGQMAAFFSTGYLQPAITQTYLLDGEGVILPKGVETPRLRNTPAKAFLAGNQTGIGLLRQLPLTRAPASPE